MDSGFDLFLRYVFLCVHLLGNYWISITDVYSKFVHFDLGLLEKDLVIYCNFCGSLSLRDLSLFKCGY